MRLDKGPKNINTGFSVAVLAAVFLAVPFAGWAQNIIVNKNRIIDRIEVDRTARVIVTFDVENLANLKAASLSAGQTHRQGTAQRKLAQSIADQTLADVIEVAGRKILQKLSSSNFSHRRTFKVIPAMVMKVNRAALEKLETLPGVVSVVEDRPEPIPTQPAQTDLDVQQLLDTPSLIQTTGVVGALDAHSRGYNGSGSYLAVLDIGVLRSHEMFTGKTIVEACFSSDSATTSAICPNGGETQYGSGAAAPPSGQGHGTHVAGIAVGNNRNYQSGEPRVGVAPGASLIAIQVYSETSGGGYGSFPSDQVRALEYVYSLRNSYRIAAVNLSLGGGDYGDVCISDPRSAIISSLDSARIAVVAATGNEYECGSTDAPACVANALAIGATDDYDQEAPFSNWDPDINDLFAPGVNVTSAWSTGNSQYQTESGTSAATPHVAGAFAILKQAKPTGTVSEFETALKETGITITSLCATGTNPRININSALNRFVTGPAPGGNFFLPPIYLLLLGDD